MPGVRLWPLSNAVLGLAQRASNSANSYLSEAGRQAEARLKTPLQVALVGLVSAGKSTLLNAMVEAAVSPTSGGECTQVLYKFSYDRWTQADAYPRDGSPRVPIGFQGSQLRSELPLPAGQVDRVEVTLPAVLLEQITLLDTPGLASTNPETSEVTQQLLKESTLNAAGAADAIIFCINTPLKDAEAEAVRLFRSEQAGLLTGGTAIAVLTKADRLTPDRRRTWKEAVDLSQSLSTKHADLFASVAPVIGLLAETARTGALRERHARALAALAREWDPQKIDYLLQDERLFCGHHATVTGELRKQLVDLLGLFGIGALIEELRGGAPPAAAEMTRIARRVSGFDRMDRALRIHLGERSDVLKAGAQLHTLMGRAQAAGDRGVYSAAQALLDRPEMFELQLFSLAKPLASGRVRPPAGLVEQAWIVLSTGLPAVTGQEAARRVREWREWSLLTDGEGQSFARVMVRAWQLAAQGKGAADGPD
jgi:predicted GTPase